MTSIKFVWYNALTDDITIYDYEWHLVIMELTWGADHLVYLGYL